MKTGNTCHPVYSRVGWDVPQWSPAMKTGNTDTQDGGVDGSAEPQWSPAMKTGNTHSRGCRRRGRRCLNGARP